MLDHLLRLCEVIQVEIPMKISSSIIHRCLQPGFESRLKTSFRMLIFNTSWDQCAVYVLHLCTAFLSSNSSRKSIERCLVMGIPTLLSKKGGVVDINSSVTMLAKSRQFLCLHRYGYFTLRMALCNTLLSRQDLDS